MAIYVTGDIHGDTHKLSNQYFPQQKDMTKDDVIVVLGDFGLVWNYRGESPYEKHWLDWIERKPFTTVFVDGNHENFDRLHSYPVEEWNGGKVHKIRPSVMHLMRGEIFNIDGYKCFAFGGAKSQDIKDGVLDPVEDKDKIKKWQYDYSKLFRINHVSWWEEEMPNEYEMTYAYDNLKEHDRNVDFIFTHDCASSTKVLLGYKETDDLNRFLEFIRTEIDFKKWYFGHLHDNRQINEKEFLLYGQIVRIA